MEPRNSREISSGRITQSFEFFIDERDAATLPPSFGVAVAASGFGGREGPPPASRTAKVLILMLLARP